MQEAAKRYLDAGMSVLPAIKAEKRPAVRSWKEYQGRLPTEAEVDAWFAAGHDGVCILTGTPSGNLELIDFDQGGEFFEPWSQKVERAAPGLLDRLAVETSQSGGWHVIYRCEDEVGGSMKVAQRMGDDDKTETLIETRGDGGLFLCAPTPGYEVVQGDLTDPPVLTEAERETLLKAAWELNEYWPKPRPCSPTSAHVGTVLNLGTQLRPGEDFSTRGDVAALLVKHGWRFRGERADGNQHWTRPGKNYGTSATVKDRTLYVFSSNAAPFEPNQAYSPFAVYALLEHSGDFAEATRALSTEGFGESPMVAVDTDISGIVGTMVEEDDDDSGETETIDPGGFPEHLLDVPGFIGEMSRFISETNYTRQPVLSLASSIAFQGFLAGRKVCDPSNARTNIYVLGLAETCCGKERARTVCKHLLAEQGDVGKAMFFERPASYQGVQKKVSRQPQCLLLWDEIGQSLRAYRKADRSPHLQGIMRTVTEMYTSAGSVYCSDTHSDEKYDFTITQPNLVVYGTSTPDELFAGLTLDSIKNGFCGRMILFEGNNDPEDVEQDASPPPPELLVDAVGEWLAFVPPGNNINAVTPQPTVVPRTSRAKVVFGDLLDQQREARRNDDPIYRALWGRAVQKASQLALIYACSKHGPNPKRLQIGEDAARWASQLVRYVTMRVLYLASNWIADDDFHDKQNEVMRFVREQGGAVNRNKITRRFYRWPMRVRDEILQNLLAAHFLTPGKGPETGRGTWYFVPGKCQRTVNTPVDGSSEED